MERREIRNAVIKAIDNILLEGCTDVTVYGTPFELKLLKEETLREIITKDVVSQLEKIVSHSGNFKELKMKKITHMLVPKKSFFDFRKCALIDIIDEIKYLSLALLIVNKVEKERVSKNIAFSYRYKLDEKGRIFDKKYNYSTFKGEYKKISCQKKYKIIIECDISNFYDRLNIHRLNSTLLSIKDLDVNVISVIDELLLFWANRDSYGLPVGSNASRILAEAFLIEVDNILISNKIKFCRFVDDYRFFAKDITEANKILTIFVDILNKHGLSINLSKTKMRDIKDYKDYTKGINKKDNFSLAEIIRGYSGIVPTKFRKLSNTEIKKLKLENTSEIIKQMKNASIIEPEDVIKCIKVIVAKEEYNDFIPLPRLLKKYPQFVPYFSDVLRKNKSNMETKTYNSILNNFVDWLKDDRTPEYILISLVKLFDASVPNEKKILLDFFKNLKRNSGTYIARTVLEQLGYNLTRGEILELKDYYLRSDCWEKRQIVDIVLHGLSQSENRPFIKDLKINCDDYFISALIEKYELENKKRK